MRTIANLRGLAIQEACVRWAIVMQQAAFRQVGEGCETDPWQIAEEADPPGIDAIL
jgi:hypothetical protein